MTWAQSAEELQRIWNDPKLLDQQRQLEEQQRARSAADQAVAQQRAALEAQQRAVLNLPEDDRRRIQGALRALDLYGGPLDGNLATPPSVKAIGDWQKAKSRPQTGRLTSDEAKMLLEDAAAKTRAKERLDSESGIAARKTDAERIITAEVAAKLFDGGREDILVLVNPAPTAPHARPGAGGRPSFKDRTAVACAPFAWELQADYRSHVATELSALGAEHLQPARTPVCATPRATFDLVLLERRHLFEQAAEKVKPLLEELRDGKLAYLATISFAEFLKRRAVLEAEREAAARAREEAARKAAEPKAAAGRAPDEPQKLRQSAEPRARTVAAAFLARLQAQIDGKGSLEEGFGDFDRWYENRKKAGYRVAGLQSDIDDFGNARFEARTLDAIALEVQFELKAGNAGAQTDCLVFAWMEETPVRRAPAVFACDRVSELEQWKAGNAFQSKWR